MLRPVKCRLSFMQYIPTEDWLGTRISIFRRHRSSVGYATRRKPDLIQLQRLLNNDHVPNENPPRNTHLDNIQPFRPPQRHHVPHGKSFKPPQRHHVPHGKARGNYKGHVPFAQRPVSPNITEADVIPYFENNVHTWASDYRTLIRMKSYGIPIEDSRKLLDAFTKDVEAGYLSDPENYTFYGLQRFSHEHYPHSIDIIYSTTFFSWAADPSRHSNLERRGVDPAITDLIYRMVKATSRPYPADEYPQARAIRRKVILHVGPTNSGKTHHALRALAAAESGVYAGPLRLLAHEVWHRLNTGQIVPLGVEQDPEDNSTSKGHPKYARLCNMITGEEQKFVGEHAKLLSCTVEMLSFNQLYDVAVIDEIQVINDPERGGGWTSAVLGLMAKEIHLCGEETAVPIVEELLKHTGDEIIVKRYERLTPLIVEDKSLGGDVKNVQEGDCIVTFSRNSIFQLKKLVEAETGLKCAVVYGRLPPEVRNDQAALFNDPDSGYDVIIGSDAIGMGLNLKIKRVIFEAMHKFTPGGDVPLSISSVKQIAGRAGRYGLHKSKVDLGGTTTTLHPGDLSALKRTIRLPYKVLPFARIDVGATLLEKTLSILPPGTSMRIALSAPQYIGRLPSHIRYLDDQYMDTPCEFVDKDWAHMSNRDKLTILYAPVPWRDKVTVNNVKRLLHLHATEFSVVLEDITRGQLFMKVMEDLETAMNNQSAAESNAKKFVTNTDTLMMLESFHKVLVLYLWMSFRNSVVYSDSSVGVLKGRLEKVLNWTLSSLKTGSDIKTRGPPSRTGKKSIYKSSIDFAGNLLTS